MLVPYGAVYVVLRELLTTGSAGRQPDAGLMVHCGWLALVGLAAALLLLYASLMCSHVAAFRLLYGLRLRLADHIGRLSPGFLTSTSVGAVKKTMEHNVEKVETFVAHTIPDVVNVLSTVVFMFVIFFRLAFPWPSSACWPWLWRLPCSMPISWAGGHAPSPRPISMRRNA